MGYILVESNIMSVAENFDLILLGFATNGHNNNKRKRIHNRNSLQHVEVRIHIRFVARFVMRFGFWQFYDYKYTSENERRSRPTKNVQ